MVTKMTVELKLEPTMITLLMPDKTSRKPMGIIKYFIIKIDKIKFLVDSMVLDFEEYLKNPLIIVKPFMNTSRMLVDIGICQVKRRIKECEECFHMIGIT